MSDLAVELDPRDDDTPEGEIHKKCQAYWLEADQYRSGFVPEWEEYEHYYDAKHWQNDEKKPHKNWIFTNIEAQVPVILDSEPSADVIPADDNIDDPQGTAKILSAAMYWVFDQQCLQLKMAQSVRANSITGNGYLYVDFDPDAQNGEGLITIKCLSWRNVWLDPTASEIDESSFVYLKFVVRASEVARRFRKKESDIKKINPRSLGEDNKGKDGQPSTQWSGVGNTSSDENQYTGTDLTVLDEIWLKDYSMIKIPQDETTQEIAKEAEQLLNGENPDVGKFEDHKGHIQSHKELKIEFVKIKFGIPTEQITVEMLENPEMLVQLFQGRMDPMMLASVVEEMSLVFAVIDDHLRSHEAYLEMNPDAMKPKYKNNMRLIICVGSDIYHDGSSEVDEDQGMVPLVPTYCYKTERSIYAFGEAKNMMSPQKSYNEMDNSEYEGLRLNTNSGYVMDDNCNVDEGTLTNKPGLVITKKAGTELKRLEPGLVSPQLANRKIDDQRCADAISGQNEASQGRLPVGVQSGNAIEALQAQAKSRTKLKTKFIEKYSLPRLGKLVCARVIKYWTTERKLRNYDEEGNLQTFHYDPDLMKNFTYELKIVPGSTAGLDKGVIYNLYKEFMLAGLLSPKTFFSVADVPYKNKILRQLEEEDQTKMIIQNLQAENDQLRMALEGQEKGKGPSKKPNNKNQGASSEQPSIAMI